MIPLCLQATTVMLTIILHVLKMSAIFFGLKYLPLYRVRMVQALKVPKMATCSYVQIDFTHAP